MFLLKGVTLCQKKSIAPLFKISRQFSINKVNYGKDKEEEEDKGPVKFTTSAGHRLSPNFAYNPESHKNVQPWYQFPVISISLISLMVYFFILREENDIDDMIGGGSLFDQVQGLEKAQLEACIMYYEKHGLDTRDLKVRLKEVIEEELAAAEAAKLAAEETAASMLAAEDAKTLQEAA